MLSRSRRRRAANVRPPSRAPLPLLLLLLVLPAEALAQAQATTGIVRGVVRDPAGAPVPTADVTVRHRETGLERRLTTTDRGIFVASLLPVGTYDVTVRAVGLFGELREENVSLRLGETVELTFQWQPVELEELHVVGEGRAPLVDPSDVTASQRLPREAFEGLPNDGRNFLEFTLLTPGAAIVQGPDGDELTISGQRGIFNNVIVDGADFNNPFFGEQRGGQRPAFTFNLDAVEEVVVVSQGAPAEFGRSAGGFVNVLTKSGTNELQGSVHYFGQFDALSAEFARGGGKPDFWQHQFGLTLGGPIVRDRAFFFVAYDHQEFEETKQTNRSVGVVEPAELAKLEGFLQGAFGGALAGDFGPITRTDDARALMTKLDWNVSDQHKASVKYNYTWSEQVNGTFDADAWALSANGVEKHFSHAVNGSLTSQLTSAVSNEFRFQWAREDRPRPYEGPLIPGAAAPGLPQFQAMGGRPFPDTAMDFVDGYRFGLPFFLPIEPAFDTRIQLVNNVSVLMGDHLFKVGGEWNRTTIKQQFVGFANGRFIFDSVDGFINFVENGPHYVTCSDGSSSTDGTCPDGASITGPVLLYLQSATVPGVPSSQLGLQSFAQNELAFFVQDTWKPAQNLTVNVGLRWEAAFQPDVFVDPEDTFYAPFLGQTSQGQAFPSDGTIPNDLNNFQPRLGLAWDVGGDARTVVRANAGSYFARIPALVFAQHRTTNGAFQQILFRNSELIAILGPPPAYTELIDTSEALPAFPDIQVASTDLQLPRTWSFSGEVIQKVTDEVAVSLGYQHARGDNLFRFVNRNDPVFGSPWSTGLPFDPSDPESPLANGINSLIVTESTARSRYHGVTLGFKGQGLAEDRLLFEANYTLSWDKSDDDNERDPFTFRYAQADRLDREYHWSDRDQRHRVNAYVLARLPGDVLVNNLIRAASAQPISERCANNQPSGERAAFPQDRICDDGTILLRNTLRKENDFLTWDVRAARTFDFGPRAQVEVIAEVFNLLNRDNFLDTAPTSLLFNFDGTLRSGLGDPRRFQLGARWRF